MADNVKNISIKLPIAIWKKIKILAINHETTMEHILVDIISKGVNNKKVENIIGEEVSWKK